jgi:hypothetical protein
MQFDRNLFTDAKPSKLERLADVALAIVLGLTFAAGLLHWCDALFY